MQMSFHMRKLALLLVQAPFQFFWELWGEVKFFLELPGSWLPSAQGAARMCSQCKVALPGCSLPWPLRLVSFSPDTFEIHPSYCASQVIHSSPSGAYSFHSWFSTHPWVASSFRLYNKVAVNIVYRFSVYISFHFFRRNTQECDVWVVVSIM